MGFGVGIAGFSTFRIVTEHTLFAMPENGQNHVVAQRCNDCFVFLITALETIDRTFTPENVLNAL